ncbi:MAG: tRNA (N(6)-L-threonylcarbamoyladenosine(37)-C(2))-methylthiotransferase MtaB [Duncaniella sp.]|nr:tRNA (N(6)-L-threonylcarbamoyladenosine(37)-C(2))-methylthiotransferase MtaB [Duncaniella sp.]
MTDPRSFTGLKALYHTFGCKLNFAETSTIAAMMAREGLQRVDEGETPDFIFVNTCSVTEIADKKCRQLIRSYARRYPKAHIVVTGCYAQLKPDEVAALPGVDIVAGNDRKLKLVDYVRSLLSGEPQQQGSGEPRQQEPAPGSGLSQGVVLPQAQAGIFHTTTASIREFSPSCSRGDRTRYFLKVQDGCDYWCTYCTIPMARGRSRSATIDEIVAQARAVAAEGGKEIVITGDNIGDFGRRTGAQGLPSGETFTDLCRALDAVEGIERYRISSIEPNLLTDELIDFVAASERFMPHFHIPLQSGSDAALRLMKRRYDTALFRDKVNRVVSAMPDAFIGIDLIVGARGETPERFEESYSFIESLPVSRLHVFTYSERPGTKALEIDHRVSQEEKHERTRRMIALSEGKLADYTSRYLGSVRPALIEHPRRDGSMAAFTDNYLRVNITNPCPELANRIVPVRISALSPDSVEETTGEIVL